MRSPKRGEIFRLKGDSVGKPRPVLIVSRTEVNGGIYVIVPFFSEQLAKRKALAQCVFFASGEFGLEKDCVAKTDEVTL
jgi:mRNA-degrading endonuclease toxin of MazEF toxin-antitoxin module